MTNKQNLVTLAIDLAEEIMDKNPTIPEEARGDIENEVFMDLMEGRNEEDIRGQVQ